MGRNAIDELLSRIGFEGISANDVQNMHWESLQREIAKWIEMFKRSMGPYFPGECKLVESVFSGYTNASAYLFRSPTQNSMIQMLYFAEAVAISKCSLEKLFKFLDVDEVLRDMDHVVSELFGGDASDVFLK